MRTTIDIPDSLMRRVKRAASQRKTTMRTLMLDALDRSLSEGPQTFTLRDASVGTDGSPLDAKAINRAIDSQREPDFTT